MAIRRTNNNDYNTSKGQKTTTSTMPQMSEADIQSLIRKKAYELWDKKGRVPGKDRENWLEAERIIRGKSR